MNYEWTPKHKPLHLTSIMRQSADTFPNSQFLCSRVAILLLLPYMNQRSNRLQHYKNSKLYRQKSNVFFSENSKVVLAQNFKLLFQYSEVGLEVVLHKPFFFRAAEHLVIQCLFQNHYSSHVISDDVNVALMQSQYPIHNI